MPDKFVVGYALDYNEYFRDLNVSILQLWEFRLLLKRTKQTKKTQIIIDNHSEYPQITSISQGKMASGWSPVLCNKNELLTGRGRGKQKRHWGRFANTYSVNLELAV